MICPGLPETEAVTLAEQMRQAVAETPFSDGGFYTLSAGVSELTAVPQDLPDLDLALGRADQAMYRAKGAGRNQVMAA